MALPPGVPTALGSHPSSSPRSLGWGSCILWLGISLVKKEMYLERYRSGEWTFWRSHSPLEKQLDKAQNGSCSAGSLWPSPLTLSWGCCWAARPGSPEQQGLSVFARDQGVNPSKGRLALPWSRQRKVGGDPGRSTEKWRVFLVPQRQPRYWRFPGRGVHVRDRNPPVAESWHRRAVPVALELQDFVWSFLRDLKGLCGIPWKGSFVSLERRQGPRRVQGRIPLKPAVWAVSPVLLSWFRTRTWLHRIGIC